MTEACAELWHQRIITEWGFVDEGSPTLAGLFRQKYRGSLVVAGLPACPHLEDQENLVEILDAEQIGVTLTDEYMLDPEQTTSPSSSPTAKRSTSSPEQRGLLWRN